VADDIEKRLAAAFGDPSGDDSLFWEREARITAVAVGLNRARSDIKKQLAGADDPRLELQRLERRYRRLSAGILERDQRRELDDLATENRERHDEVLEQAAATERARRLRMTLGQRLDEALNRAELLTTVPAGAVAVATRSKPSSSPPPKALNVRHDAVDAKELSLAARYRYVIGQFLERLEDEVDTAERRPASSERQQQTLEARDQRLARWRGVASHVVSTLDPSLGSPRTIENARDRLGQRRSDGNELKEKS
jgi:hypothetical protein